MKTIKFYQLTRRNFDFSETKAVEYWKRYFEFIKKLKKTNPPFEGGRGNLWKNIV